MECTVKWVDNVTFLAETGSNHAILMDGAPEAGGRNLAPRPMELLLAGAGGCTAFDIVLILKRGRHQVSGCEVSLKADRAETDPKIFTHIHFHFTVRGKQLKPEAVARGPLTFPRTNIVPPPSCWGRRQPLPTTTKLSRKPSPRGYM